MNGWLEGVRRLNATIFGDESLSFPNSIWERNKGGNSIARGGKNRRPDATVGFDMRLEE